MKINWVMSDLYYLKAGPKLANWDLTALIQ